MKPGIPLTSGTLHFLKKALNEAKEAGVDQFTFSHLGERHELYVPYAEHLVVFMEDRLKNKS